MRLQPLRLKRMFVVLSSLIAIFAATAVISAAAGQHGESDSSRRQSVRPPAALPVVVRTDSPAVISKAFPGDVPTARPEAPKTLPVVVDPSPVDLRTSLVFRSTPRS